MKRLQYLVYVVALTVGISYGMHGPVLPIFAKEVVGASYAELGLIGFANFIPYMFIPVFVGVLLNRFNNGYLLAVGIAINSVSIYLLSTAQTIPEIIVFRVLTGIAHAFFWPPSESIISSTSKGISRVTNIAMFTGFFVSGFMIGPLIGSHLLEDADVTFRMLFQIASFVIATGVMASLLIARGHVRSHQEKFSFSSIKLMKKFPSVIMIMLYCNMVFGTVLIIYPAFLSDNSFTGSQVELIFFVFGISRVASLVFVRKLSKKTSVVLATSVISIALGLFVSFIAQGMIEHMIALSLMGYGFSMFFPLTFEIVLSKTKESARGTIIGSYEAIFGIGWVIGPIITGFISQYYGNATPYVVFAVMGVIVFGIVLIRRRSLEPKQHI